MFYDNFAALCRERGVAPSAVMRAVGLNKSSASYWKKGSIPSGDTLQKLADYFGVSVDYLLGIKELPRGKNGISQEEQETSAILNFFRDIGYVLLNIVEESAAAVILDRRSNQWYEIPIEVLSEIEQSITAFSKFQINEMLSKYAPRTHLDRSRQRVLNQPIVRPQSMPLASEGTDTTPPPDSAEGPQEDEE